MDPATKQDLEAVERRLETKIDQLKVWIVERENAWIKWVMGIQVTYFVITLGAMYFMAGHVK
jgi:hypothetical protein